MLEPMYRNRLIVENPQVCNEDTHYENPTLTLQQAKDLREQVPSLL